MPIYKSTLIKFLKSFSTWLPLAVTLIVVALVGGILPFLFLDLEAPSIIQTYKLYIVASVSTIGSATSLVSATFASYKAVQIYKQEIEEGTFLILVSKPISRRKIIFEKWLALLTVISLYVFILISFYLIIVLIIDPGPKIVNLDISPIRDQIFAVSAILMVIILLLTLMFSSIALIISSKVSSSATIALVASLGAVIPITGLIPTFTNKQPQLMITNPNSPLNATKTPRDETIEFIQKVTNGNFSIDKTNILNLFGEVNDVYNKIENNKDDTYVNRLGVSSREKDVYSDLFFLDLNYQISSIATIASDLLISKSDKNFIASGAMIGGFTQMPSLSGKVSVTKNDIQISELSKMLLNTLNEYGNVVTSDEYGSGIYPFFDYILSVNNVVADETTNDNFSQNLSNLLIALSNLKPNDYKNFFSSPIVSTILKDDSVDESLKRELENENNPFLGEIEGIEVLMLIKINMEMGLGINLIISNKFVDDFYKENEIDKFVDINEALLYLNELMALGNNNIEEIMNKFCTTSAGYNKTSILQLANTLKLSEKSKDGINSFEFTDYANKWVLFGIYSSIAFILLPISYLIIKKQDIR